MWLALTEGSSTLGVKMHKAVALRLADRIRRESRDYQVLGLHRYGRGSYSLRVIQRSIGIPFMVYTVTEWLERVEKEGRGTDDAGEVKART